MDFLLTIKEQMLPLLEQGVHLFVASLMSKVHLTMITMRYLTNALCDAGIVFGFLVMLVHYIKVGQFGKTLLLMRRGVNVFSMPLMTHRFVS